MTDSLFTNTYAHSPNGRWRVEATATQQQGWSTEVTCTLLDSGRPLWSQKFSRDPVGSVYVADDGWFVILTWAYVVVVVRPGGAVICNHALIMPGRIDRDVIHTSAGPIVRFESVGLQDVEGRFCFLVETETDPAIAIELVSGQLFVPSRTYLEARCNEREARKAAERKDEEHKRALWPNHPPAIAPTLDRLVSDCGQRSRDMELWLRVLEMDTRAVPFSRAGVVATIYPFRQLARAGLYRLGEMTSFGQPPVVIEQMPPPPAAYQGPPVFGADHIAVGMPMAFVRHIAGPPERLDESSWSYDRDPVLTIDVSWDMATATVTRVEKVAPHWETHWPEEAVLESCRRMMARR